jgi:hypothetical protein
MSASDCIGLPQQTSDKLQNALTVIQSVTPPFLPADAEGDDGGDPVAPRRSRLPAAARRKAWRG